MSKFLGGIASEIYNQTSGGNQIQSFIPRTKFEFTVIIQHINPDASSGLITRSFTRISSIDMPSHNMKATTLNQYNRKRIVQTGVDYNPITMTAYDTRDAEIEKFLTLYNSWYYTGVMNSPDQSVYTSDIYNPAFVKGSSFSGYKLQPDKNFIKTLQIIRKSSNNDVNIITLWNPFIQAIQADTLDYSQSQPVSYRISFMYEGYDVRTNSFPGQEIEQKKQKIPSEAPALVGKDNPFAYGGGTGYPPSRGTSVVDKPYEATAYPVGESTFSETGTVSSITAGDVTTGNTRFEEEVLRNGLNGAL